jgi:hypothetical protein
MEKNNKKLTNDEFQDVIITLSNIDEAPLPFHEVVNRAR